MFRNSFPRHRRHLPHWLTLAALLAVSAALGLVGFAQPPASAPLVLPADLAYVGTFRLPPGQSDRERFDYGATALAYRPGHDSLIMVGHDWFQLAAEVDIPLPATAGRVEDLPVAKIRQPLADVLDGRIGEIGEGSAKIGGLLPWGDSLIVSAYLYYDAGATQVRSHFRSSPVLSRSGDLQGPFKVGRGEAGFVSGYMTSIPEAWRAALGGPALTGQCCLSIISRTSFGPSVSVFDPADVGVKNPVPASMVLGYPADHPSLGECGQQSSVFNCTTSMGGVVFPPGTRSVLFFGRQGTGPYCYGEGGAAGACPDPTSEAKGPHAYPYVHQVWAYDVLDLIAVKQGRRRPWDVRPYRTWTLSLPHSTESREIWGAAYDPARGRIFLSTGVAGGDRVVHVLGIRRSGAIQ